MFPSIHGCVWLLMVCWASLALAILCGILALSGKARASSDVANDICDTRRMVGDTEAYRILISLPGHKVRWYFSAAAKALCVLFVVALVSLTLFACLNLPH